MTLLRLGRQRHVLLLTLHHIIADGWSLRVIARELTALYAAFSAPLSAPPEGQPALSALLSAPLSALPIQYADYARWQRQWLEEAGDQGESPWRTQLDYWRRQLAGAPPLLALPTDHPRPSLPTSAGARVALALPAALTAMLGTLGQQSRATLFMTLLAAWQVLLARYSGQNDIVVGTPIAGRTRAETEGLIGCFVNTLVVRTDLSGDPPFRELLRRVREVCLQAYAHQDLPFELLVEELRPERDLSHTPLFQVMFALQQSALPTLELTGLTIIPGSGTTDTAKFDLSLDLVETSAGLSGELEYSTDLFDAATISRMLGHFQALLEGIVAAPDCRISALPLLTAAERQQLLVEWNATQAVYPHEHCLHTLFEAQAARAPDALAVVFEDQQLTYAALNARANRLAHHLRARGVGPEVGVGVCLERSVELVIALLAVLKAGGAYVPLDPAYPAERRQYMLADAQVALLLTTQEQRTKNQEQKTDRTTDRKGVLHTPSVDHVHTPSVDHVHTPSVDHVHTPSVDHVHTPSVDHVHTPSVDHVHTPSVDHVHTPSVDDERAYSTTPSAALRQPVVIDLIADWSTIARQSATNLDGGAQADNLAYVIYTSGSTGRPKGVGCRHAGVVNLLADLARRLPIAAGDACSCWTSISFDVSVYEIWSALLSGGALHLVPDHVRSSGPAFIEWLQARQIRSAYIPPFLLRDLDVWLGQAAAPLPLRRLLVGVEPLSEALLASIGAGIPGVLIVNGYGPTEVSICTTVYAVDPTAPHERITPIGRPVQNTQHYLLDGWMQLVPVGVAGELYIGGAGLARGYLNSPDLTAERFVPCPWSVVSGPLSVATDNGPLTTDNRLYRTGDLCRYLPDGNIEFLGRSDGQIKLRGFRIEPGEIEAALHQHSDVREAVVLAREDVPSEKRLVAYIVPDQEQRTKNKEQKTEKPHSQFSILNSQFSGELRAFLKERLPEYMVPSAFVLLEALPLTSNGKLDRRALPAPAWTGDQDAFVAPRTPLEELVAGLWAGVLGVERVGVEDNFFALGGHSLLATQVLARIHSSLGVELPLRELFAAPTVAGVAERLALALSTGPLPQPPPLVPLARNGPLPLSFAQQRLWFLDQLAPTLPVYSIAAAVRLAGTLQVAALARSLLALVERHETLRTTFVVLDGEPLQVVRGARANGEAAAFHETPLPLIDLRGLASGERAEVARRLAQDEAGRPFELARGPLLRATLLRLDVAEHLLLLTMHHIITDGWSLGVLVREVAALYQGFSLGQPVRLPELAIHYADFAQWQRAWLQPGERSTSPLQAQLSYWRAQLAGDLPVLRLPADRPRSIAPTFHGARQALTLPTSLSTTLAAFSLREDVTLFMTLLAAWQALLARYSGQDDIGVGTPIAGRTRAETEHLIGFFVNTLVLRTDLSGDPPFRELLRRVREVCLGAYAHQDLPFDLLVEELRPERSMGHTPLFQVLFALQNAPLPELELAGLALQPLEIDSGTAKFDLTMSVQQTSHGLSASLEYSTDLFEAATISRMLGHFQVLLEGIVADPECRISALPLLTAAERQLLLEWNATAVEYPRDRCIHDLFADQARRTPEHLAVIFEDQRLTYAELNRRANQLARYLRRLGVGPEARVGICLERSADLVVALLGILKAGAAYVPLDPTYPHERLAWMQSDAQVSVLLTNQEQRTTQRVPDQEQSATDRTGVLHMPPAHDERAYSTTPQPTVVELDADWERIAQEQATDLECGATADNLAYVMYTSGSTGTPKGIAITHRAIGRLVLNTDYVRLGPGDRVAQASNAAFDAATFEIWGALLHGAQLVGIPQAVALAPQDFAARIHEHGISTLFLTTALFNQLAATAKWSFAPLRQVLFGGEAVDVRWVGAVLRNGAPARLLHVYGPTECTTFASWYLVREVPERAATLPIGRPIANTQLYILDRRMEPVPVGVAGELYIGGDGLARGYLDRPDLTAERFVPCPWSVVSSQLQRTTDPSTSLRASNGQRTTDNRLYRTGDLCRYRSDGNIEFLGRLDGQVKLRGFRIELDEIASALRQHPDVRDVVVVVREDVPGEKRLVAYVVANQEQRTKNKEQSSEKEASQFSILNSQFSGELRAFLKERLPEYMVPSAFVLLEALPLTSNGKLDRRALPAPAWTGDQDAFVAPRTPLEELVVGLWAGVLGVERVGVEDNFFALGGHSLLATQVLARIHSSLGVELPLRELFAAPTVAGVAERLALALSTGPLPQPPPLVPLARNGPLPLSFAQQRLWFLDQLAPALPVYSIAAAVRLAGTLQVAALARSLLALVERHETLRTTFVVLDGEPLQVVRGARANGEAAAFHETPLPLIDLRGLASGERAEVARRLAQDEAGRPFELARGPLLRATLLRLDAAEHLLLLTMHHIIADGWSLGVLVREVAALYQGFSLGQPVRLPELAIHYADFAQWQRAWLQGAGEHGTSPLQAQLTYWKRQLARLPTPALPTDRPRPPVQTFRGATRLLTLPTPLLDALTSLSRRAGVTLFMTLLAAFKTMLRYHTGADDIVVGTDVANRTRAEVEGLIGFFVNQLVLRTDLSGDPTFEALLERVRAVALAAYAHQDIPFDLLVAELAPERDPSRSPLFQVLFILQNAPVPALELPGLTITPLNIDYGIAHLDLLFLLTETPEGLRCAIQYNTDLFQAPTIARMAQHFEALLRHIVEHPQARLSALEEIMADVDRQRQASKESRLAATSREKLKSIKRRAIRET